MIRAAHRDDIPAMARIIQQSEKSWNKKVIQDCFKVNYKLYVSVFNNVVVGFAIVYCVIDTWELMQIAVDHAQYKKGFGSALMAHLITQARDQLVSTIQLDVRQSNKRAIQFYLKYGFEQVGIRKQYYSDNENALLYNLNVM